MKPLGIQLRLAATSAAVAGAVFAPSLTQADPKYPSQPIRMIVGFAPGTSTDIFGRIVADELQRHLGQSVVVENKPGATAAIAWRDVARSTPDGYTLIIGTAASTCLAPATIPNYSIVPSEEFEAVGAAADMDVVLVTNPKRTPATSVPEFFDWAKGQDGVFFGTFGVGTFGHLGAVLLADTGGFKMDPIHYRAAADATTAIVSGDIQAMLISSASAEPQINAGVMRGFARSGFSRTESLPDIPTFKELGYENLEFVSWNGVFAPKDTPSEILDALNATMQKIAKDPQVVAKLKSAGFSSMGADMSRQQFSELVKSDCARWAKVAQQAELSKSPM